MQRLGCSLALIIALLPLRSGASPAPRPVTNVAKGAPAVSSCCAIVELRQYTLYPGKRDALIALFEREFVESQEAVGMRLLGQFRDVDDPNRFVWLRGFASMDARKAALTSFYFGPVWQAHRGAANATMYDSDNVLLLRPASPATAFALPSGRPGDGAPEPRGFVVATTYSFAAPVTDAVTQWFTQRLQPAVTEAGARVLGALVTEASENTFPRLPVREGEHVFVWLAAFPDRAAYEAHLARLATNTWWAHDGFAELHKQLRKPPEVLRLTPTPRSLLGRAR